jgi:hypothetical protein
MVLTKGAKRDGLKLDSAILANEPMLLNKVPVAEPDLHLVTVGLEKVCASELVRIREFGK